MNEPPPQRVAVIGDCVCAASPPSSQPAISWIVIICLKVLIIRCKLNWMMVEPQSGRAAVAGAQLPPAF